MTTMIESPALEIGSDKATETVLSAMIDHENAVGNGIVYYGRATRKSATVAHRAIGENLELGDTVREAVPCEFRAGQDFWLGAELSGVLFESLCRYAMRERVCDVVADVHGGYVGVWCDCKLRDYARSWASGIAERTAGVALV